MSRHGHQWNDLPSSSSKRLKRQRWQRTAPECAIVHRIDVARRASCTHCWLTVGRHKWGRRANLLSAVISWLTQCGKTWEWRRPPHLLLAAGPMVDSMWEDWSRHGYITNVRDMSAFCPTVGRGATDLVKILITTKRWHSCGNLNFILSVFVALTTSSIYIAVLLRPGTFPFWYRHRACDLRAGAVFFVGHRLKSSTNSPKFVPWLPEVTCFDDSTRKFDALFVCSSEFCMRMTTHTVTTTTMQNNQLH